MSGTIFNSPAPFGFPFGGTKLAIQNLDASRGAFHSGPISIKKVSPRQLRGGDKFSPVKFSDLGYFGGA